jgi:6-phosphogluconolactonase
MEWITTENVASAERAAAEFIAARLVRAIGERGHATFAISGGRSPWGMLNQLARQDVPWDKVHVFQVDERFVPLDDEARNWARFGETELAQRIAAQNRHPMPVEREPEAAAIEYAGEIMMNTGAPAILDVVQLGLGKDGHTASLFAGDPLLTERDRDVAVSQPYQGNRRLTLTLPAMNRARFVVWFVVGADRKNAATRLFNDDPAIPASLIQRDNATCFTDADAAPDT